ncbi:MAG: maleylacetoacetate isomerase [Sphingomonadales bacterium]|jgi:maleylacetoacetate isomerase
MILLGYWRSTAAWRVRLALAYKGLAYEQQPVNLVAGAQRSPEHLALNPQGLVPVLIDGDAVLTQSLAIIEYLEDRQPQPPLLPATPAARALVRSAALIVAADVHPLGNLRVQQWLRREMGQDDAAVSVWLQQWIGDGLAALEDFAEKHGGRCLYGDTPTLADLVLIPQLYNARRFGVPLEKQPILVAIGSRIVGENWATAAHPDQQMDKNP